MNFRKIITAASAFAVALCTLAVPASAADSTTYCQAGVCWMIKDQWDHRNTVGADALNEMEDAQVSCTHTDVNITGNGQYEVILEGYVVPAEDIEFVEVGMLGIDFNIDMTANPDFKVNIDELTMDGTTYTFNAQPELEANGEDWVVKVKNGYGDVPDATPAMDNKPWTTTDAITFKFTVSGLATDKVADNADEQIVKTYGTPADDTADSVVESEAESVAEATTTTTTAASKADTTASSTADSNSDGDTNWLLYGGIAAGVVVVAVIIVVIVKKK